MNNYDVAIIGTGIAGSTLGAILARQGLSVVMFEASQHPRFSIGESMILETSETMRTLAEFYDVPEIAYFSSENFLAQAGTSHGVKRHFGFLHHKGGNLSHDPLRTLQAVIPKEPHGHELHIYRQDSDYYMMTCAIKYGATVLQNTRVADVRMLPDFVEVETEQGAVVSADYLVDAAGFRSPVAKKLGLRSESQQTNSRAIFTHMVGVGVHAADSQPAAYNLPFAMHEGTLHHVFEGGWLWVIPFNNHKTSTNPLTSVGLMLDPRIHPVDNTLTPEAEFYKFIKRFPNIAQQFEGARSVRNWVRTSRIQYKSSQIVGDRWALLGHAAGFVDPLYSKGLYVSLTAVNILADKLLTAQATKDYSRQSFLVVETVTQHYLAHNDRLVANSYKAFANFRLWQVYAVLWLLGAYTEYLMLNGIRARSQGDRAAYMKHLQGMHLVGGGFEDFRPIANAVDSIIEAVNPQNELQVDTAVGEINHIFRQIEWMPAPFIALLDGATTLPKNKLRLSLLRKEVGFLGKGNYRRHFFGDHEMLDMLQVFVKEKLRYSRITLNIEHKRAARRTNAQQKLPRVPLSSKI